MERDNNNDTSLNKLFTIENGNIIVKYNDFCDEVDNYKPFMDVDNNKVLMIGGESSYIMSTAIARLRELHKSIDSCLKANKTVIIEDVDIITEENYRKWLKKNRDTLMPYIRLLEKHDNYKIGE